MKLSADNKQPYLPPVVEVAAYHVERGFSASRPEPECFSLDHLLGSQESPVQYSEATEATGWNPNFE